MQKELAEILNFIKDGNPMGEKITLVGATKTVDIQTINKAVEAGLKVVAENKVKEFREKTELIKGAEQQFIGHLQTNKVKYLVGYVTLIQSVDSFKLAQEINNYAIKRSVVQHILCEINVGGEQSKSGFPFDMAETAIEEISQLKNIKIDGIMAMLPQTDDVNALESLCKNTRALYDKMNKKGFGFTTLSMGMTEDYKIAVKCGSNMIRIGSGIFGKRNYEVK